MMCELLGGVMTGGYTIEPSHFRSHKTIVNSMTMIIIDPSFLAGSAGDLTCAGSLRLLCLCRCTSWCVLSQAARRAYIAE